MDHFTPKHLFFQISEIKKKEGITCCALRCNNPANKRKRGLCHKHYSRHRKIVDPVYDRFMNFKNNPKRRHKGEGIEFTITLQEFRHFCQRTGYIIQKGKRGYNCTIDRRCPVHGYHIWNIQILSIRSNIRKYHDHDKIFTNPSEDYLDDLPF